MIILNQVNSKNIIKIIDLTDNISTNEYYKKLWKSKYNINLSKKTTFSKNLVNYLKGETNYIK
jgi:hypothetical protein